MVLSVYGPSPAVLATPFLPTSLLSREMPRKLEFTVPECRIMLVKVYHGLVSHHSYSLRYLPQLVQLSEAALHNPHPPFLKPPAHPKTDQITPYTYPHSFTSAQQKVQKKYPQLGKCITRSPDRQPSVSSSSGYPLITFK